jgi:hypothetical protein
MNRRSDSLDRERADLADELAPLNRRHAGRLRCGRGCADCCVDDITVFEVEAERIRERHGTLLAEGVPHPAGACAFLDGEGACRIYEDRPYVCRTQGYPLRWIDEPDDGAAVERRDICPLNETGEPITELPAEACWTVGPHEARLALLQHARDGGKLRRVALRDLFGEG